MGGARPIIKTTLFCGNIEEHTYGLYTDGGGNEFNETCCQSDIDGNSYVGVNDILNLVSFWDTDNVNVDINNDGIVGTNDLLQLIADWETCTQTGCFCLASCFRFVSLNSFLRKRMSSGVISTSSSS